MPSQSQQQPHPPPSAPKIRPSLFDPMLKVMGEGGGNLMGDYCIMRAADSGEIQ
jgi:hypothetical protein